MTIQSEFLYRSNSIEFILFIYFTHHILDSTLAVISATTGSTAIALASPSPHRKQCRNSCAVNASTRATHKSCIAFAGNHTMSHSFTSAVTSARTGSTAVVWEYCRVKRTTSTSIFAQSARKIVQ